MSNYPQTLELSNGKQVFVQRPLKGRDQLKANKLASEPDEVPFWLLTFVVTLDEKGESPLIYEELMDLDLFDLLTMQNAVLMSPKSV